AAPRARGPAAAPPGCPPARSRTSAGAPAPGRARRARAALRRPASLPDRRKAPSRSRRTGEGGLGQLLLQLPDAVGGGGQVALALGAGGLLALEVRLALHQRVEELLRLGPRQVQLRAHRPQLVPHGGGGLLGVAAELALAVEVRRRSGELLLQLRGLLPR